MNMTKVRERYERAMETLAQALRGPDLYLDEERGCQAAIENLQKQIAHKKATEVVNVWSVVLSGKK